MSFSSEWTVHSPTYFYFTIKKVILKMRLLHFETVYLLSFIFTQLLMEAFCILHTQEKGNSGMALWQHNYVFTVYNWLHRLIFASKRWWLHVADIKRHHNCLYFVCMFCCLLASLLLFISIFLCYNRLVGVYTVCSTFLAYICMS